MGVDVGSPLGSPAACIPESFVEDVSAQIWLQVASVPAELLADLAGHQDTRSLLTTYRHTGGTPVRVGATEVDRLLGGTR